MWLQTLTIISSFLLSSCEIPGISNMFRSFSNPFGSGSARDSRCESLINIIIHNYAGTGGVVETGGKEKIAQ